MKERDMRAYAPAAIGSLFAVAARCAAQLPSTTEATLRYQLSWQDTGNHNGIVEPGEGAAFSLTVLMTPTINTIIHYSGGFAGVGRLRGVGYCWFDLLGSGGCEGSWTDIIIDESWDIYPAGHGAPAGGGSELRGILFGQYVVTDVWNTANPLIDVFRATWTPADYAPRTAGWTMAPSNGVGSGVLVRPNNAGNWVELVQCLSDFGQPLSIPIVPAPPGAGAIALGGVVAAGRRRRRRGNP
jgi:hypothetical protein